MIGVASVLLGLAAAPRSAAAEGRSEALFTRGLADMLAGRHETGCPALAESYKLEPLPGTLFTLAECEAQRGRSATAVASYEAYLALFSTLSPERQAKQRGREIIAARQRALLGQDVPLLTVTLGPGAPSGTVVRRDGEELPRTGWVSRSLSIRESTSSGHKRLAGLPSSFALPSVAAKKRRSCPRWALAPKRRLRRPRRRRPRDPPSSASAPMCSGGSAPRGSSSAA